MSKASSMCFNMSIDADPQQQEAASPLVLVVRSFLRSWIGYRQFMCTSRGFLRSRVCDRRWWIWRPWSN